MPLFVADKLKKCTIDKLVKTVEFKSDLQIRTNALKQLNDILSAWKGFKTNDVIN